jgi:hypothetical protein
VSAQRSAVSADAEADRVEARLRGDRDQVGRRDAEQRQVLKPGHARHGRLLAVMN